MIQRVQSIYLLLTTVLSVLFLLSGIIYFTESSGSLLKISFNGLFRETGMQNNELVNSILPLTVLLIIIPLLAFVIIFLFKNRSIQIILTRVLITLITMLIVTIAAYSIAISEKFGASINPVFNTAIPLVQLALAVLALRGIKKDDDLVKSYDRLR